VAAADEQATQHGQAHRVAWKDLSEKVLLLRGRRVWVGDADASLEACTPHGNEFAKPRRLELDELDARGGVHRPNVSTKRHATARATLPRMKFVRRNHGARSFYEGNGFVTVAHGFDALWQLESVNLHWSARAQNAT
jgi:hypothetical protein